MTEGSAESCRQQLYPLMAVLFTASPTVPMAIAVPIPTTSCSFLCVLFSAEPHGKLPALPQPDSHQLFHPSTQMGWWRIVGRGVSQFPLGASAAAGAVHELLCGLLWWCLWWQLHDGHWTSLIPSSTQALASQSALMGDMIWKIFCFPGEVLVLCSQHCWKVMSLSVGCWLLSVQSIALL